MVFSVIPRRAVVQAKTKMRRPKKTCKGMYAARRWDARPGNRKVIKPASH
jgi:hypothetical protein